MGLVCMASKSPLLTKYFFLSSSVEDLLMPCCWRGVLLSSQGTEQWEGGKRWFVSSTLYSR